MMIEIEAIREAVATALEKVGHGNELFIRSVREGGQDDGPFMVGAIAVMNLVKQDENDGKERS